MQGGGCRRILNDVDFNPCRLAGEAALGQGSQGRPGEADDSSRERLADNPTSWRRNTSHPHVCTRADSEQIIPAHPRPVRLGQLRASSAFGFGAFGWLPRASPSSWSLALGWRERPGKLARQTMALESLEEPDSTFLTGAPGSYMRPGLAHLMRLDQTPVGQTPGQRK
jgi:hypothetical protein